MYHTNIQAWVNSVDPDQMPQNATSDQGYQENCLPENCPPPPPPHKKKKQKKKKKKNCSRENRPRQIIAPPPSENWPHLHWTDSIDFLGNIYLFNDGDYMIILYIYI